MTKIIGLLFTGLLLIMSGFISFSKSTTTCTHLIGNGDILKSVIIAAGFDDADPNDVESFERLSGVIADGFSTTEPYASNFDKFSITRVDDYRGKTIDPTTNDVWYNPLVFEIAAACDYNQIIVIAHNSGWAGGAPGNYTVVGSGTPITCDPNTCSGDNCPWTPNCSWDDNIAWTALHETGHTFAALRHTCFSLSEENNKLNQIEKVSISSWLTVQDDPINCGIGFPGDEELVCTEWNNEDYFQWSYPNEPHFGCYIGCDNNSNWYRPWDYAANIMCMDTMLENGFTPVDRKLLFDMLNGDYHCYALNVIPQPLFEGYTIETPARIICSFGFMGYRDGTSMSTEAFPYNEEKYVFDHWSGDIISDTNPVTFTINSDMTIYANFKPNIQIFYVPLIFNLR